MLKLVNIRAENDPSFINSAFSNDAANTPRAVSERDRCDGLHGREKPVASENWQQAQPPRRIQVGPDVRRCFSCGDDMITHRYQRQFLRYVRCYRCVRCDQGMKHETRGFQGFYIGALIAFLAPLILGGMVPQAHPAFFFGIAAFVLGIGLVPMIQTLRRARQAPIMRRNWSILLPRSSGRTLIGRILGGDSRFVGMLLGVASIGLLAVLLVALTAFRQAL